MHCVGIPLYMSEAAPFIGPALMKVGGCGHALVPDLLRSSGVRPWRANCGLIVYAPIDIDRSG